MKKVGRIEVSVRVYEVTADGDEKETSSELLWAATSALILPDGVLQRASCMPAEFNEIKGKAHDRLDMLLADMRRTLKRRYSKDGEAARVE